MGEDTHWLYYLEHCERLYYLEHQCLVNYRAECSHSATCSAKCQHDHKKSIEMSFTGDNERTPLLRASSVHDPEVQATISRSDTAEGSVSEEVVTSAAAAGGLSSDQKIWLCGLGGANLLAGCLIAVMIPFFPLEAANRGVSSTVTGAVFSCFALTQLLAYPVMGRIIPVLGVTRIMNSGLLMAGVSTIAFGALNLISNTHWFIAACFMMRIVEAIGTSALNTSVFTIVANSFDTSSGFAVGFLETMNGVGIALGPAIGGALYNLGGYGTPFYTLGAIMIAMSIFNLVYMPCVQTETATTATTERHHWKMIVTYFTSADIMLCSALTFTVGVNFTTMDPVVERYVFHTMHVTPSQLGVYFLVATGCYTLAGIVWGKISDSVANTYCLLTMCLVGVGVGFLLLPPSPLLSLKPVRWLFGTGLTVKEIFECGAYVPLFGKIYAVCVQNGLEDNLITQSFVSSMFFTFFCLGNVVGPTVGGVVNATVGFPMMVTYLAAWTFLLAMVTLCFALRLCFITDRRLTAH